MDSVKPSDVTQRRSKFARAVSKVLHIRAATGIAPLDGIQKVNSLEKETKKDQTSSKNCVSKSKSFDSQAKEFHNITSLEALLAKLLANISSVKAAYAQLQYSQSPYDAEGIQEADEMIIAELKKLSELKQCYLKKEFESSPERTMLLANIEEQKSDLKTYEVMGKQLESQVRLKDSELIFLKEKLEEGIKHNRLVEKRLNQSGPLFALDNLHLSGVNPSHFMRVLRHAVKSIRSFVRLIMDNMVSAGWDIDTAASAIEPDAVYWKDDHKWFALESFVCREMFDNFQYPNFTLRNESLPVKKKFRQLFFGTFMELKSVKAKEFLTLNPKSAFAKFCSVKYLHLIHPKMESSFYGNLNQRSLVKSGQFPDTTFFTSFAGMAKWVWLLHCLAFSFKPEASIFQIQKGCRFSEVYMATVTEEAFTSSDSEPLVAFTVIPGFKIGKTVIQCQVYLSQLTPRIKPGPRLQKVKLPL